MTTKNLFNKLGLRNGWHIFTVLFVSLFLAANLGFGQIQRTVGIGEMYYGTSEAGGNDFIGWPQEGTDVNDNYISVGNRLQTFGFYIGLEKDWTDLGGTNWQAQIAMMVDNKSTDFNDIAVPQTFSRTFRLPYPSRVVDGVNWTWINDRNDPVDETIPADAMIHNQWEFWPAADDPMGLSMDRYLYFFADDKYDDFVIAEYIIENIKGQQVDGVYFALAGGFNSNAYYPGDLWGDYYGTTYPAFAGGDATADSMRFWYGWDADETVSEDIDDRGNPNSVWGYFTEPQSMGMVVLHADAAPGNDSDDPNQPSKAGWSYRELAPDLNISNHNDIFNPYMSGPWYNNLVGQNYSLPLDRNGNETAFGAPDNFFRTLDPAVFEADYFGNPSFPEHRFDPNNEQNKQMLMSFGPYDFADGEDVRIVVAFVGGTIPQDLAIEAGRAYLNGNDAQRGDTTLANNIYYNLDDPYSPNPDLAGGGLIASAGEYIGEWEQDDFLKKDLILNMSKDLAFKKAGEVIRLWQDPANTVYAGEGEFNSIPLAPASPSLNVESQFETISIGWGNESEDSYPGEITGYNIYKRYWRPPSSIEPTDTAYVLLASVGPDVREYVDSEVIVGEQYRYYVTALRDANGETIESSHYQNRMQWNDGNEPASPERPFDENWQDNVVVVPNPFHAIAADKYGGNRLNFMNLPAYCDIHIYTMTGDRIRTLRHTDGDGDEEWLKQLTRSQMPIVSGVYLFVVEERESPNGPKTGEKAFGKFVVIQ
ncbi:MAG: hypothetical protein GF372_03895 [Candidatus Marinimicrobia bacterium]|nr:hypothetical protein [Candidatus Neomarinimicrobiota bacterium]